LGLWDVHVNIWPSDGHVSSSFTPAAVFPPILSFSRKSLRKLLWKSVGEANGCLPCVRVTHACSKHKELLPRYTTLFYFRFVAQDSEMMAIKCIEHNMRIHSLQDRSKIVYICGDFTLFLCSNPSIDGLSYVKY
jgi:hypothetical protein